MSDEARKLRAEKLADAFMLAMEAQTDSEFWEELFGEGGRFPPLSEDEKPRSGADDHPNGEAPA